MVSYSFQFVLILYHFDIWLEPFFNELKKIILKIFKSNINTLLFYTEWEYYNKLNPLKQYGIKCFERIIQNNAYSSDLIENFLFLCFQTFWDQIGIYFVNTISILTY